MSSDPNSPLSPPMMSPDRKWVWDGHQWIPVADPSAPAHQSVFPAFDAATRDVPAVSAAPAAVQVPIPYNVAPAPAPARPVGPLWGRPQTGLNKYLYIVAGGLVAVIAVVVLLQFIGVALPGINTPVASATPSPSPGPVLSARTDAAKADLYVNGILFPTLSGLNDILRPVQQGCGTTMTVVCGAAIPPADRQLKKVIQSIDDSTRQAPACIAPGVLAVRHDIFLMDVNLVDAATAFDNNQQGLVKAYLLGYRAWIQNLAADEKGITQRLQPTCEPAISGP